MTSLERALACILESIEDARTEKDALALAGLLQRKDAICAALAAPEHWHDPRERGPIALAPGEIAEALEMPMPLVA
jgi:hypothetical protein